MGLPPNIEPQESPLSLLMLLCEGDFNPPIMIHVTFLGLLVLNAVALKSSFSSSVAQHPKWRLDRLNFAVSRSHKNRHTTGRTPLTEWSAVAQAVIHTTVNENYRRTSMSSAGLEPSIPFIKQLQAYALARQLRSAFSHINRMSTLGRNMQLHSCFVSVGQEHCFYKRL